MSDDQKFTGVMPQKKLKAKPQKPATKPVAADEPVTIKVKLTPAMARVFREGAAAAQQKYVDEGHPPLIHASTPEEFKKRLDELTFYFALDRICVSISEAQEKQRKRALKGLPAEDEEEYDEDADKQPT